MARSNPIRLGIVGTGGIGHIHAELASASSAVARFAGTKGSLSFPSLTLWGYDAANPDPGWWSPLQSHRVNTKRRDPYAQQIEHFAQVIRGEAAPLVSGEDGLRSLAVVAIDIDTVLHDS